MADEVSKQPIAPAPQKGQIVTDAALYLTQISLYRNSIAFGGTRNPTAIWAAMTYNQPEAMAYYRELEAKDEDVANCLDTLRLSVLERDRSVDAFDDSAQALEVQTFIEQQLAPLDFHQVLDCMLDAPGYGFSVQEMMFDVSAGQASLIEIADCPQELFLFGNRYYPQVGPLQYLDQPWASQGQPVPEDKFIVFTYRKRGRNRMGRPLLQSVFWPSWFKRNMQRLWVQFAEKGPGTAVVRYNDPDNQAEMQQAANIAQAIVERTAIAVPKTFEYDAELLKVARSQNPDVYMKFFQAMQYSIARRVLGETLTSFGNEGGGGSKAQGETHANTLDQRSVELCRQLESVINQQLVKPLVLWNFGPNAPVPQWHFDLEEAEDLEVRLTIDSGLQRMGKKFSIGYIADRYDAPLAEGEKPDDVMVPNVNAPAVALRDTSSPSFSEAADRLNYGARRLRQLKRERRAFAEEQEAVAAAELEEFDKLFEGLRTGAADLYKQRTKEIVESVVPVGGA
jgi:phage gp29-like protein